MAEDPCTDPQCDHPQHRGPEYERALFDAYCDLFITWDEYYRELRRAQARQRRHLESVNRP